MKKTVLKLWTENCWKSIFPETYANLVKRTNGKTVEESLVAVEQRVSEELDEKVNKEYVDAIKSELQSQLVGKVDYLGLFNDESGETLWTNTEHITAGDYFISAIEDGNTGAKIGDIIIARVDHPSKPADWDVIEANHEVLPYEVFCDVQGVQKRGNAIWIFYGSGYVIAIPIEAGDGVVVEPNASYDAIRISSDGSSGGVPFVRLA